MHFLYFLFIIFVCCERSAQSDEFGTTKNADAHKITDDLNTNIRAKNASADIKHLLNNTATSPVPPVIERIEIRLVDSQNATDETPLIIVDVVKKNGSAGVAATIQQAIQTEKPALDEDVGSPKPDKSFLVRLRQPNYHSVSFVPFEATTTTTEQPNLEANNADENQIIETTELPVGQMVHIMPTDEAPRKFDDQNDDKMTPGRMKTIRNEEDKRTDQREADDSDEDDEEMAEDLGGRDEFVVNEAAILGETTNLLHNNDDTLASSSSYFGFGFVGSGFSSDFP
uniref:Secreted protein n=1 Tax=Globodera pallida TaxID=36090 RepID=A0A183BWG4_GLOPA